MNDFLFRGLLLLCLPRKHFSPAGTLPHLSNPAILFLLSLQSPSCGSALHVQKLGVSFQYCLALRAVGQHHGYRRILFEVSITGCRLADRFLTVNYCPVSMVQLSWFTRTVCSDCATGLLLASIRTG